MKALTASIILVMGMASAGCGKSFAVASPDDSGMDAAQDDALTSDVSISGDSANGDVSPDVDRVDASAGDAQRSDGGAMDVARDGAADVAGDVRNDGAADAAPRDGAFADNVSVDAGRIDLTLVDAISIDRSVDGLCSPETDQEFCKRLGKNCEVASGNDNCGTLRNANCGSCVVGLACVDGVCKTPVCTSFNYSAAIYQPFSVSGLSDFAIAASAHGESILYAQSSAVDCSTAVTYLADEITPGSRTYTSRSIKAWLDGLGVTGQALTGDGLTLITLSSDYKTYQAARRSALHLIDFSAPSASDFTAVNGMLAGTTGLLRGAVISTDGLEFYYTMFGLDPMTDGLYRAKRASTSSPFSVGARLTGIDASYTDVTGISSDRLTLFVFKTWGGFVFTRSSTSAEFSNPNAPNPPPEIAGFHHKPFADCATILTTMAIGGGCSSQDIYFQTRR